MIFFLFASLIYIQEKITFDEPLVVLKTPLLSSLNIKGPENLKFSLKGDTLIIESPLSPYDTIYIKYRSFNLGQPYRLNEIAYKDVEFSKPEREKKATLPPSFRFSGNKGIGFQAGSAGFNINQSTRVELGGDIKPGFSVEGVFQDQGLPQETGGITRELSELEQAFLRAKSPYFSGVIGDFFLKEERGDIQRKIQGMSFTLTRKNDFVQAGFGAGRGEFESVFISGIPGFQGPYEIPLREGEYILPNTERVYLNGFLLKQGKNQDYIMDNERGTLLFTPKITLTSNSRIRVDFERGSEGYGRLFGLTKAQKNFGNTELSVVYFQETDDKKSPHFSLSNSEISLLRSIGDTTEVIQGTGYTEVDSGKGDYILKGDTLVYVGKNKGNYVANFIFVGSGQGDYTFNSLIGGFQYVGVNQGEYAPGKNLYLPKRRDFASLTVKNSIYEARTLFSNYDKNTFSSLDDGDNIGKGGEFKTNIHKETGILNIGLKTHYRTLDKKFVSPIRIEENERPYLWGIEEERGEEKLFLLNPYIIFFNALKTSVDWGRLRKGALRSQREEYRIESLKFINLSTSLEHIKRSGDLYRFKLDISKKLSAFKPMIGYFQERQDTTFYEEKMGGFALFKDENLQMRFKEVRRRAHQYLLIGETEALWRWKKFINLSFLLKGQQGSKIGEEKIRNIFYNVRGELSPLSSITSSFSLYQNQEASFEKIVEYIWVGEGQGNFSYDSLTGTFYQDADGDYIKKEFFTKTPERAIDREFWTSVSYTLEQANFDLQTKWKKRESAGKILRDEKEILLNFGFPVFIKNTRTLQILTYRDIREGEFTLFPVRFFFFSYQPSITQNLGKLSLELGFNLQTEFEKGEEESLERQRTRIQSIKPGISVVFKRGNLNFQLELGQSKKKTPLYTGDDIMRRNFIYLVPNFSFSILWGIQLTGHLRFIFQDVQGDLPRTSFLEKEKYRFEWNSEIKRKIGKNLELSAGFSGRRGESSTPQNTFRANIMAYF